VTDREWALLFHLVGLVLLFSGLTLAAAALAAARRREHPGEIAALLGLTRSGVVLVAAGALLLAARRYAPAFGDRAVAAPEAGDRLTRA
jgi:hypothetical protein